MQRGIFKKLTYEDKFDRAYACWVKNNPRAWAWWKRKNRKEARHKLKKELRSEIDEQKEVGNNAINKHDMVGDSQ